MVFKAGLTVYFLAVDISALSDFYYLADKFRYILKQNQTKNFFYFFITNFFFFSYSVVLVLELCYNLIMIKKQKHFYKLFGTVMKNKICPTEHIIPRSSNIYMNSGATV